MKELTESPPISAFRARFEAGRSFDLDDDLEFCPGLLTEDDVSLVAVPRLYLGLCYILTLLIQRTYHSCNLSTPLLQMALSLVAPPTHPPCSNRSNHNNK